MHLALIISSLSTGGAERVLAKLANYWENQGHRVSLITLSSPNTLSFYPLNDKVDLIQLNQSQVSPSVLGRIVGIIKRVLHIRQVIGKLEPDIVISFMDMMNITTLISAASLKVPIIVCERNHPKYHLIPKLYVWLRRLLYPRAACVITQTKSAASYFKYLNNIKIIPNAVYPISSKKVITPEIHNIIAVGTLCPRKGFDCLINAFYFVVKYMPDLMLRIYGEGFDRARLEKLIISLGLQDKVMLMGITKNIYDALLQGDIFVFPSRFEGFPNALCEAMAIGLPVIASNCSGNIDIIQSGINGRLFPIDDVQALTSIMLEICKDFTQRKQLARNAQKICQRFNPEDILHLWDKLVKDNTRTSPTQN